MIFLPLYSNLRWRRRKRNTWKTTDTSKIKLNNDNDFIFISAFFRLYSFHCGPTLSHAESISIQLMGQPFPHLLLFTLTPLYIPPQSLTPTYSTHSFFSLQISFISYIHIQLFSNAEKRNEEYLLQIFSFSFAVNIVSLPDIFRLIDR